MLSKISGAIAPIMGVGALAILANISLPSVFADNPSPADANFQVNVAEALSVSVTVPEDWASGNVGDLLRNKISLSVLSNNPNGFTASMTTKTNNTNLVHDSIETTTGSTTIPTLTSNWTRSDTSTTNFWGYSINDENETGTYSPLVGLGGTPIEIISRTESIDPSNPVTSRDIYFGAKANASKVAGTYSNTIVISVVSGMISPDNPITPDNPVIPSDGPNSSDQVTYNASPTGGSSNGATSYTYRSSGSDGGVATSTSTTNVNDGDVRSLYQDPAGAKRSTESNVAGNSILTTALAVTASIAAGAGVLFLILAKRNRDDEEEK